MESENLVFIGEYYEHIKRASKESIKKEIFKDLLNRLFSKSSDAKNVIDSITLGAETTVLNIPRGSKIHRGSADTLYSNIIIEFENDLVKTGKHAKEQLAGYLLGQIRTGHDYNFTLIASDFITWKVYFPDTDQIANLNSLTESELRLIENKEAGFVLTRNNYEDFYYWIDTYLFAEGKQKATLKSIELGFGYRSSTFIESIRIFTDWYQEAKKYGEVQVSVSEWRRFLSVAYGKFDGGDQTFLVHTYLSVFSKMLAYSFVAQVDFLPEEVLKKILDGSVFQQYNIHNFVENDFFHWVHSDRNFPKLVKALRVIAQEISKYDFKFVDEDVLKGVYQELIDIDTRHALGEYYTPDWLCERVVQEYKFQKDDRILDPSCGSGSFLRAIVHRLRVLNSDITIEEIANAVYGYDIHPLSVQIAKTTLLIALGENLNKLKRPIKINVLLANTLLAPDGVASLFAADFSIRIYDVETTVYTEILDDSSMYDAALDAVDMLAEQTIHGKTVPFKDFAESLKNNLKTDLSKNFYSSFYSIYKAFKNAKEKGKDTIWKFILSNTYKPYFMKQKFNYVIGNPPWFTYSDIKNTEYQKLLYTLAVKYNVKPIKAANLTQMEIAAIFMAHCSSYFLIKNPKNRAQIAFVLPRSFFTGDQHSNTREGLAKGFALKSIWDLNEVAPLFNVPSCVLFGEQALMGEIPSNGFDGLTFKGKVKSHNSNLKQVAPLLKETISRFYISTLGKSTAISQQSSQAIQKTNPYHILFKNGATIFPRCFYFIEIDEQVVTDFINRLIYCQSSIEILKDAKQPWKLETLEGRIESSYFYYTALSKSVLPYLIFSPSLIVLPINISKNNSDLKVANMLSSEQIFRNGDRYASVWFSNVSNLWNAHRTEKSEKMDFLNRINFQKGLTSQNLNHRYMVMYTASAKDANAGVLDRNDYKLEFFADGKTFYYSTNNQTEAYYLVAMLNSQTANKKIKDFQSTGLFGPRDVSKKILDVYFPIFAEAEPLHLLIAKASLKLSQLVKNFVLNQDLSNYGGGRALGQLRLLINKEFAKEMAELDILVSQVIE